MKTQLSTLEMLMKGKVTFILATFFVLSFTSLSFSQNKQLVNPNAIVIENGDTLHYFDVPGKPPEKFRAPVALPTDNATILNNVPAYDWSFGCAATSAAMIAGYYDYNLYPGMYTGPANGGLAPMTNAVWGLVIINGDTLKQCPLSATRNGVDGRTTRGHVDDYWIKYGNTGPDPYIANGWAQHAYEDCTGDFMKTNQSAFNNSDGSTRFYFWNDGTKWSGTLADDGGYGFELFMDSRNATVTDRFTQLIYGYNGNTKGFTFSDFRQEINNGNPVLIHVTGHTMVGFGYDNATNSVYLHDTWDYSDHQMTWGGGYPHSSGTLNHWGVTVLHLSPNIIYVKWDATGLNNGTSWNDAYVNLTNAIAAAQPGNVVWVARGTYIPTGNGAGRYRHFTLKNEVSIYGGFEGTENPGNFNLFDRNFLDNETILDGQNDRYHVIYNAGINASALLDGFTIKNGNANGDYNQIPPPDETLRGGGMYNVESSPRIENCLFTGNFAGARGGGVYNWYSHPAVRYCVFNNNISYEAGGGMFNLNSNPVIINCLFSGNMSGMGAGLGNERSHPEIYNSTIAANLAIGCGGGIFNADNEFSIVLINNCIIWNNQVLNQNGNGDYYGHQICNWTNNTTTLENTCINNGGNFHIYNEGNLILGAGCIFANPLFVLPEPAVNAPTTAGNYRLQLTSPAKDAGDNLLIPAGINLDLDWNPRIAFLIVDMGAYESPEDCLPPKNLAAKNVTASSADLTWTPGGSEGRWRLEWGPAGFAQGTGTMVNNILATPYPLIGLTASTCYEFYVQAVCGAQNFSVWAGPKSFCTNNGSITQYDFGDAPDPGYPTLLPFGANHKMGSGLKLGNQIDPEPDGLPDPFSLGDDNSANDDEDGVKFLNSLVPGENANIEVLVTGNGFLNGWVDFDGNGSWLEAGEQVLVDVPVAAGTVSYAFAVPPAAVPGATFTRFRLSSVQGLGFEGAAPDGEVEDYEVFIHHPASHKMHFAQYPELDGWAVNITEPNLAADDFLCTKSGPIDNIYFWMSMKGDVGTNEPGACIGWINVSIHADIPASQSPTGFSMPADPPLWEQFFFDGDYTLNPYFQFPEGWYSPFNNLVIVKDHEQCFNINIENIQNPFVQTSGTIYWLRIAIHSWFPGIEFGWETSPDHFNDAATWNFPFGSYPPLSWNKLTNPLTQESLDLAFYINSNPDLHVQMLAIPEGWSGISTWLAPQPGDVQSMFAPCINSIVVLKNGPDIYWPAQNINTIGVWDAEKGYIIKMSDDATLQVSGQNMAYLSVALKAGWNLVPVLSSAPVDVVSVLGGLPCVVVAKGITRGVYWPVFSINTIGNLQPGSAYWIYTTCDCVLTYPVNPLKSGISQKYTPEQEIISPWNQVVKTQGSHLMVLPVSTFSGFGRNAVIGAFNSQGFCTGIAQFRDGNTAMTIFGDDPTTPETDGMREGERIIFRVFNPDKGTLNELIPDFDPSMPDSDGTFKNNGLSLPGFKTFLENQEYDGFVSLYPNPAGKFVQIRFSEPGFKGSEVSVYNLTGQLVLQSTLADCPATTIETSHLLPGVYQLVIASAHKTFCRKLIIK